MLLSSTNLSKRKRLKDGRRSDGRSPHRGRMEWTEGRGGSDRNTVRFEETKTMCNMTHSHTIVAMERD